MDNAKMLVEVNDAILTILKGGQSYKIGTRQVTRADLKELQRLRNTLEQQQGAGSVLLEDTAVAFFDGR
jgi:hypothetical protein